MAGYIIANHIAETAKTPTPLTSIHDAIAFDSGDWAEGRGQAWVYGIVCGWGSALDEVAERFGWTDAAKERLAKLHKSWKAMEKTEAKS